MSKLENNFSIYPYGYEDELAEKRVLRETEERQRNQLADELSFDLGVVAMAAVTGIAGREYEKPSYQPTPEQNRKFGHASVKHLVAISHDHTLVTSLYAEQAPPIDEHAFAGYGDRQTA